MRCTNALLHRIKILNFKLKMTDSNHSIYYSYQTLVENQIFIFSKFFVIYWAKRKLLDWRIFNSPIVTIFFLQKKQINFIREFYMENKLNGLNRLFLT
jgi:hypothetical protein